MFAIILVLAAEQFGSGTGVHTDAPPPEKSVSGSFAEDYPAAALRNNEQGVSVLEFDITTEGKVINCTASGATKTLDEAACAIATRRWLYKPAMNNGTPVVSHVTKRVRWVIPKR